MSKEEADVVLSDLESPSKEWCSPDQRRCIGSILRTRIAELEAEAARYKGVIGILEKDIEVLEAHLPRWVSVTEPSPATDESTTREADGQ